MKIVSVLVITLLAFFAFTACGGGDERASIDLPNVRAEMNEAFSYSLFSEAGFSLPDQPFTIHTKLVDNDRIEELALEIAENVMLPIENPDGTLKSINAIDHRDGQDDIEVVVDILLFGLSGSGEDYGPLFLQEGDMVVEVTVSYAECDSCVKTLAVVSPDGDLRFEAVTFLYQHVVGTSNP